MLAEARREMIAARASLNQEGLAEAFATVLRLGGESGLESLYLPRSLRARDALARFIVEIGKQDQTGHCRRLYTTYDEPSLTSQKYPNPRNRS